MAGFKGASVMTLVSILGIIISGYARYAEYMTEYNKHMGLSPYKALCDIGTWASCSKVFDSQWGRIWNYFGIPEFVGAEEGSTLHFVLTEPNASYGVLFYLCVLTAIYVPLAHVRVRHYLLFFGATFGIVLSAYLAYILAFVLKDFCIVCVSSYVFNTTIFIYAVTNVISPPEDKKKLK